VLALENALKIARLEAKKGLISRIEGTIESQLTGSGEQ
jgi:hypothetical protein